MAGCNWDVAESRFLSAMADSDVREILRKAVYDFEKSAPGKIDRADLEQESLWALFETCRKENLRHVGIEQFSSLLRKILIRSLLDATTKRFSCQKRDVKLEVVSIDDVEDDGADFSFAIARESVEELVVENEFREKLEIEVCRTGNPVTIAVYASIVDDSSWGGSRTTYLRHRRKIVDVGRALLGARPMTETNHEAMI